jgi:hypothetical protein
LFVRKVNQVNKEIEMVSISKEAPKNFGPSPRCSFIAPCAPLLLYSGKIVVLVLAATRKVHAGEIPQEF